MKTETKYVVDFEKLRDLRERYGLSATDLAVLLLSEYNYKTSMVNIYRLEKDGEANKTEPSSTLLFCLADLYKISVESLFKSNPNYVRKTAKDNIMPQSQPALSKTNCYRRKHKNVIKIKEPVF